TQSTPVEPLTNLSVPTFDFPVLRAPASPRAETTASRAAAPRGTARVHGSRTGSAPQPQRVAVVTNAYATVPPPAKPKKPGPTPPVVEDTVGAPPLISSAATEAPADATA